MNIATLDTARTYEEAKVRNPMLDYPGNMPCICGSGHKFRRCHRSAAIERIPVSEAEKIRKLLQRAL